MVAVAVAAAVVAAEADPAMVAANGAVTGMAIQDTKVEHT